MSSTRTKPFLAVHPPTRVKLSDSIVTQIERLILDGSLKPGDALPPERDFAQQLGVSRPSVREAVLKLEARGLLEARRSGGFIVADVTGPTLTDPLVHLLEQHPPAISDILELRHGLEEVAAGLAARRATELDRRALAARFEELSRADLAQGDGPHDTQVDLEFHLAVADASHNVALMHVMRGLANLLRSSTYRFRSTIFTRPDSGHLLREQHKAIYDAIVAGDPAAARAATHRHLKYVEEALGIGEQGSGIRE